MGCFTIETQLQDLLMCLTVFNALEAMCTKQIQIIANIKWLSIVWLRQKLMIVVVLTNSVNVTSCSVSVSVSDVFSFVVPVVIESVWQPLETIDFPFNQEIDKPHYHNYENIFPWSCACHSYYLPEFSVIVNTKWVNIIKSVQL